MSSAFHEKSQHFPPFFTHIAPQDGKTTVAIPNKGICPTTRKEITTMSTKNSNKLNIPEAKAAMDKFKMEAASEEDVYPPQGFFPTLDFWLKYRKNAFFKKAIL